MKRLYQKIYLTIIVSLLVVALVAGTVWRIFGGEQREAGAEKLGILIAAALPGTDAPQPLQRQALIDLASRLRLPMSLYDRQRNLIVTSDPTLPALGDPGAKRRWRRGILTIRLPDQRHIVTQAPWRKRPPAYRLLAFLISVALAVGLCAYPVVRGLTRRLERLQAGVETLGSGNFQARVQVKGSDEVARLAASFNEAATRIETLLGAHQQLLANASHELRTPLARLTMGFELARDRIDPERKKDLRRDLAELDDLIEEILTASRLETLPELANVETIDLLALVAEESASFDIAIVHSDMVSLNGDARLLRRVIRNLLENARRYGKPPIDVTLTRRANLAILDVIDAGPGIAESESEKVFEPFYRTNIAQATPLDGARSSNPTAAHVNSGSGIGLALVRQIARRHGGDAVVVQLKDRPAGDQRNRIRVTLPIA